MLKLCVLVCHRFNATKMLELIRGKRLVFVGDSINRNQWESMLCMLMGALRDPSRVFETHRRRITKEKGNYSFKFVVILRNSSFIFSSMCKLIQFWILKVFLNHRITSVQLNIM